MARSFPRPAAALLFLLSSAPPVLAQPSAAGPGGRRVAPMLLERNLGQAEAGADFVAEGNGATLLLGPGGATFRLPGGPPPEQPGAAVQKPLTVRLRLVGAKGVARLREPVPMPVRWRRIGGDPAAAKRDIPVFGRVDYDDAYPGISVAYHGVSGRLHLDFQVSKGGDPRAIQLAYEGVEEVRLLPSGELAIRVHGGELRQSAPVAFQHAGGRRQPVEIGYTVKGGVVGFAVGRYDRGQALVIDPVLSYSTLYGGAYADVTHGVAVDAAGRTFAVGKNYSLTKKRAFLARFGATGALEAELIVTGNGDQMANAVALDAAGRPHVVGWTISDNLPTSANAYSRTCGVGPRCDESSNTHVRRPDAFLFRTDGDLGTPDYFTYFGGSQDEWANGVAVDELGGVYMTGANAYGQLPTRGGLPGAGRANGSCPYDAFVAKFDLSQSGPSGLVYSTYLGGDGNDEGLAVAARAGIAYVAGITGRMLGGGYLTTGQALLFNCPASLMGTTAVKFPTTPGAFADPGSTVSAFLSAVAPAGNSFSYSTVPPGTLDGRGVAVNQSGTAYLAGSAAQGLPVTPGAFQASYRGGGSDAFLAAFAPAGTLAAATYLGGTAADTATAVAVGPQGRVAVAGTTHSVDFPASPGALQPALAVAPDAFVASLDGGLQTAPYATYLGGSGWDEGRAAAAPESGLVVGGTTTSIDFPTTGAALAGNYDAFVASVRMGSDLRVTKTTVPATVAAGQDATFSLTVTNVGPDPATGVHLRDLLPAGLVPVVLPYSPHPCSLVFPGMIDCALGGMLPGTTATLPILVRTTGAGTFVNHASVSSGGPDPDHSNDTAAATLTVTATADLYAWMTQSPANPVGLGTDVDYTVWVGNNGPDLANPVELRFQLPAFNVLAIPAGCAPTGPGATTFACQAGPLSGGSTPGVQAVPFAFRAGPTAAGTFAVQASVTGAVVDPSPGNDVMTLQTQIVQGAPIIKVHNVEVGRLSPTQLVVVIQIQNVGTGVALDLQLAQATASATSGAGSVTLTSPAPPVPLGTLQPGAFASVRYQATIAPPVAAFRLDQAGTLKDYSGTVRPWGTSSPVRVP